MPDEEKVIAPQTQSVEEPKVEVSKPIEQTLPKLNLII